MASVNFDSTVGGDGSTVSDGTDPTTGLDGGGWRTRFVPALAQIVAIAVFVKNTAINVLGWSNSANNSANTASLAASTATSQAGVATTQAGLAQGYAAGVNMPSMLGKALNFLRANSGASGFEYRTPAQLLSDISAAGLSANVFTAKQTLPNAIIPRTALGTIAVSGTATLDYAASQYYTATLQAGAVTIALANAPAAGNFSSVLLAVTNAGTATITFPAATWFKGDGTSAGTFSSTGVALQSAGINFMQFWTDGTTTYARAW